MNIVIIPFHDYKKWKNEGFRTRDAHLCQHFARSADVEKILVVNRPTSLAECILKRKDWRTSKNQEYCGHGIQLSKMGNKIWCIDFYIPDFAKVIVQRKQWWFTAFNYSKVINEINRAIDYLNMKDAILLLQNPMAIGAVERVNCNKFAFDAIDNWLYHPQMKDKELIKRNYEYVDTNANLILTVSKALIEVFVRNSNVHWVPNGVDVKYFAPAVEDHMKSSKPIIGYVGKIQDRVDFNLVEKCLKAFPNVEFRFLGPVYAQKNRVKVLGRQYKNIEFLGDIHYSKLPEAMKEFDVAVIPHNIDCFTSSMNPLKLYEYLAAGKIVVTTGVAGTNNISDYVYSADNEDEFISCLKKAIRVATGKTKIADTIVHSIPKDCYWSSRADTILKLLKCM